MRCPKCHKWSWFNIWDTRISDEKTMKRKTGVSRDKTNKVGESLNLEMLLLIRAVGIDKSLG